MANILKLGLPKGSLQKSTIDLFEKAGYKILLREQRLFMILLEISDTARRLGCGPGRKSKRMCR